MADINVALKKLYADNWDRLTELRAKHPGLSAPILMKLSEKYDAQHKPNLFVVGQQTCGWDEPKGTEVSDAMTTYAQFDFGNNPNGKSYRHKNFWRAVSKLEVLLGIDDSCLAYSNFNRMDWTGGAPEGKVADDLCELAGILKGELEVCEPSIIVFFTGHPFDSRLEEKLGAKLTELMRFKNNEVLSKVDLPGTRACVYRTPHPNNLVRSYSGKGCDTVLEAIITDYKKNLSRAKKEFMPERA